MRLSKGFCLALVGVVALLPLAGCSDDDVVDIPVEEAVEAGIESAMTTTVVPLFTFMGTVGDLLSTPVARAVGGFACPDTTGWCSAGTVTCSVGTNGLDFDFDECQVVTGDLPMLLDGNVSAIPGTTVFLTLTNLFINNNEPISGTGTIDIAGCNYTVNVSADGTSVAGTVIQCDSDEYPTGNTVVIAFDDFLITVLLNGTSTAPATATQGATPVADCTIDLDDFTTSCVAF